MRAFWEKSQGKLSQFNPQELANSLYACAQLNLQPESPWMGAFWSASEGKLSEFTPQGLANTLYACAQLNLQPEDGWMEAFWKASEEKLSDFKPQDFANTLHSCVMMGCDTPDEFIQGIRTMKEIFNPKGWHQLYTASVFADLSLDFPEDLVDQLRAFEDKGVSALEERAEKEIWKRLGEENVLHSHWISGAATTVDFFVQKHNLIIQVDGPTHYLSDGSQNGNTRFQTRLLEKLGYRVLRLGYRELDQDAKTYIKQQLAPFSLKQQVFEQSVHEKPPPSESSRFTVIVIL
jgi:very-short-patch-repair endonuclease